MKRIIAIMIASLLASCFAANGQGLLRSLGERAKNAVENKLGEKVEGAVGKVVDKAAAKAENKAKGTKGKEVQEASETSVEGWTCPECYKKGNTGPRCSDCDAPKPGTQAAETKPAEKPASKPAKPQVQAGYAKSDFVPGDEIFFDDPVEGERLGEFPSHWDFLSGEECEIMTLDGVQAIKLSGWCSEITPLMKEKDYLPEEFTIEFDVWSNTDWGSSNNNHLDFILFSDEYDPCVRVSFNPAGLGPEEAGIDPPADLHYDSKSPSGDVREGTTPGKTVEKYFEPGTWTKVQVSFNKRAFKYYINGNRVVNLPNVAKPTRFKLSSVSNMDEKDRFYIRNIRMAKGAVPLYDRLASEGKIVTYAITFETGKADIKPESFVEIARIAKLMQDNPGLEFEVQGHCDATGSDKVNDPLSQKRAEAIVAALVEQGIAQARLTPVGKGSHVPIASNSTDEGRTKNRRVEFVKK